MQPEAPESSPPATNSTPVIKLLRPAASLPNPASATKIVLISPGGTKLPPLSGAGVSVRLAAEGQTPLKVMSGQKSNGVAAARPTYKSYDDTASFLQKVKVSAQNKSGGNGMNSNKSPAGRFPQGSNIFSEFALHSKPKSTANLKPSPVKVVTCAGGYQPAAPSVPKTSPNVFYNLERSSSLGSSQDPIELSSASSTPVKELPPPDAAIEPDSGDSSDCYEVKGQGGNSEAKGRDGPPAWKNSKESHGGLTSTQVSKPAASSNPPPSKSRKEKGSSRRDTHHKRDPTLEIESNLGKAWDYEPGPSSKRRRKPPTYFGYEDHELTYNHGLNPLPSPSHASDSEDSVASSKQSSTGSTSSSKPVHSGKLSAGKSRASVDDTSDDRDSTSDEETLAHSVKDKEREVEKEVKRIAFRLYFRDVVESVRREKSGINDEQIASTITEMYTKIDKEQRTSYERRARQEVQASQPPKSEKSSTESETQSPGKMKQKLANFKIPKKPQPPKEPEESKPEESKPKPKPKSTEKGEKRERKRKKKPEIVEVDSQSSSSSESSSSSSSDDEVERKVEVPPKPVVKAPIPEEPPKPSRICMNCTKEAMKTKLWSKDGAYCSLSCMELHHKKLLNDWLDERTRAAERKREQMELHAEKKARDFFCVGTEDEEESTVGSNENQAKTENTEKPEESKTPEISKTELTPSVEEETMQTEEQTTDPPSSTNGAMESPDSDSPPPPSTPMDTL